MERSRDYKFPIRNRSSHNQLASIPHELCLFPCSREQYLNMDSLACRIKFTVLLASCTFPLPPPSAAMKLTLTTSCLATLAAFLFEDYGSQVVNAAAFDRLITPTLDIGCMRPIFSHFACVVELPPCGFRCYFKRVHQ